jgi:ADP-ribosylglycohydrolase
MLPSYRLLRAQLRAIIANKEEQGHDVAGLEEELAILPDSYDFLAAFAQRLARLPLRRDWPYVEPNELEEIWAECDPERPKNAIGAVDLRESARRVEAAFLGSVCGCILGKPVEINPTLAQLKEALESEGEWPLNDYFSERVIAKLNGVHPCWVETVRERIHYVAPDDDINYTILGMLILEKHGIHFSKENVRDAWLHHLPIGTTFGPERTMLLKAGMNTLDGGDPAALDDWGKVLNPGDEYCGALIRADAYGYACPGRPALAAELAWRDASWSHRRTGIYGAMFVAAAIAAAQVMEDRLGIFQTALKFVPRRSRFYAIAAHSLSEVAQARDWLDGYQSIHERYQEYTHCRIYQEIGTLMNTLRFAESVGDGICKQVSQGNDTDSFGATAGSLLGAYFGPGHLEPRWLAPFRGDIHTALAWFYERSLPRLAKRMGKLPGQVALELGALRRPRRRRARA